MIAIPASLRSDFIHIPGTPIHIALESTIHITGIRIPTYGVSGRLAAIWSCHTSLARFPHIGQALDLQVWKTNFSWIAEAYTSIPNAAVRQSTIFRKFFRAAGRVPG